MNSGIEIFSTWRKQLWCQGWRKGCTRYKSRNLSQIMHEVPRSIFYIASFPSIPHIQKHFKNTQKSEAHTLLEYMWTLNAPSWTHTPTHRRRKSERGTLASHFWHEFPLQASSVTFVLFFLITTSIRFASLLLHLRTFSLHFWSCSTTWGHTCPSDAPLCSTSLDFSIHCKLPRHLFSYVAN